MDMYKSLADAAVMIATRKAICNRFNCDQFTYDWLLKQFAWEGAPSGSWFGIPISVVEHLAPGFIEAEMSDGTKQIIKLKKDKPTPTETTDTGEK